MRYKNSARELGIHHPIVSCWVKQIKAESIKGLEEKRGKTNGPGLGRSRVRPEYSETKIKRLKAENAMLKSS
ncbi:MULTISPECIES: hypothetical protein [Bacillus cereus group]|uniref:hypothetical protein n=1 Tax=Bacillus cereus group TaxID=86661 RepID=UPI001D014386|nr:hypothetical protein [Bacillus thuringiensis]